MTWEIKVNNFLESDIIKNGHKFITGNLSLGLRGTLDEFRAEQMVALNLPLIYDQVGNKWRESVNAFNPLYTVVKVDGSEVSTLTNQPISHHQTLNMSNATMKRESVFDNGQRRITIKSTRFVDKNYKRAIFGTFEVEVSKGTYIDIFTGIDTQVWDINGPHLENIQTNRQKDLLKVSGITQEKKHHIVVYKTTEMLFNDYEKTLVKKHGVVGYNIKFYAKRNTVYRFNQYTYVAVDEKVDVVERKIKTFKNIGIETLHNNHTKVWSEMWEDANIVLKGNEEADTALRYSLYHLLLLQPDANINQSIPARGISGQVYKGAIFWDTEVFMLPFYLNTNPLAAKSLINYRVNGLKGALNKALEYGYQGAFYAWESQEDGLDACTDYNVTDVFTNRLVRTYFKDKQIHISADVVYAIKLYLEKTNDFSILIDGCLEVILEVARFYLSYGSINPLTDDLEFLDVMGPDEYHERVNNNLFTNLMVKMVFELVIELESHYQKQNNNYFKEISNKINFNKELSLIKQYVHKIVINKPNEKGVIEQFDGYFKHKDINLETLLSQKLHPNEYLGGYGLAGDTQIIKQADVITALYMFRELFNNEVFESNFKYYEPRTEHGSSLSASMYAIIAAWIGMSEYAYPLFMKSATIDLTGKSKQYAGSIYIGGTHPAAAGGAYLTAIYGFAGLMIEDNEIKLNVNLPKEINGISFKIKHQNKQYQITIDNDKQEVRRIS